MPAARQPSAPPPRLAVDLRPPAFLNRDVRDPYTLAQFAALNGYDPRARMRALQELAERAARGSR
jgi:hypothetical protein